MIRRWFTPATRDDWKNEPFPEAVLPLTVEKHLSAEVYASVKLGRIPEEMEDKWFAFWENDWLYYYRSWTGLAIFKVRFVPDGTGVNIAEAWREDAGALRASDAEAARILLDLITYFERRAQEMR